MADLDPKKYSEQKNYNSVKDLHTPMKSIKQVPSDAEYERRKRETAAVGEGAPNLEAVDINRRL